MKAADFDYVRPDTLDAALACMADDNVDTRVLAGGQSLMPAMNFRLAQPERLVDLGGIEQLRFVHDRDSSISIGAMTTFAQLQASEAIASYFPLLKSALPHIAHPAIRSRGTIGGSAALADPAAELPALLLAVEAQLELVSTTGSRTVDARDFFVGTYETGLQTGELIRSVSIPKAPDSACCAFYELARRHGDYAMAGVAVVADAVNPIANLRIAFFAIGGAAVRASAAETVLEGKSLNDTGAVDAALDAVRQLEYRGDLNAGPETKCHLAKIVLKRALAELAQ